MYLAQKAWLGKVLRTDTNLCDTQGDKSVFVLMHQHRIFHNCILQYFALRAILRAVALLNCWTAAQTSEDTYSCLHLLHFLRFISH